MDGVGCGSSISSSLMSVIFVLLFVSSLRWFVRCGRRVGVTFAFGLSLFGKVLVDLFRRLVFRS